MDQKVEEFLLPKCMVKVGSENFITSFLFGLLDFSNEMNLIFII